MDAQLKAHLWKSAAVRQAFTKEPFRLLKFVLGYAIGVAVFYYFSEKPSKYAPLEAVVGAAAIVIMWLVSVIRTVQSALQENQ